MSVELVVRKKIAPFPGIFPSPNPIEVGNFEPGYLAWNATRKLNPYNQETGFEGYFVGTNLSPEEVAREISKLGVETIRSIKTLHRNDPNYLSRLNKVLRGEHYDLDLLADLNSRLMVVIGKLRVQIHPHTNKKGDQFRSEISALVRGKRMSYLEEDGVVTQHEIPLPDVDSPLSIFEVAAQLTSEQARDGYLFMGYLGRAGYPLVRMALRHRY